MQPEESPEELRRPGLSAASIVAAIAFAYTLVVTVVLLFIESFFEDKMEPVLADAQARGVAIRDEKGALVVDLPGLPTFLLQRTDGGIVRWVCASSHAPGDGGVNPCAVSPVM